eukprot:jgi/Ulvmu1/6619/UM003_0256.1
MTTSDVSSVACLDIQHAQTLWMLHAIADSRMTEASVWISARVPQMAPLLHHTTAAQQASNPMAAITPAASLEAADIRISGWLLVLMGLDHVGSMCMCPQPSETL